MIAALAALLGIASTLLAWFLNPKRRRDATLLSLHDQLEELYVKRDGALRANDSDSLTVLNGDIVKLRQRRAVLLQQR